MFPNLDVLRSIAVLAVLFCHISHFVLPSTDADGIFEIVGRLGVILFFVHTSLVLMMSLERSHSEPHFIARFYVRRIFRIYPLSMVAVLISYTLHVPSAPWWSAVFQPVSAPNLLANLLLMQNLTRHPPILVPLWSLPLEVQMYVLLPFLFLLVIRPDWRKILFLCWGIAALLALASWLLFQKLNLLAFIPCFLAGVLAFKRSDKTKRLPSWLWPVLLCGLIATTACAHFYLNQSVPASVLCEWAMALIVGWTWSSFREVESKTAKFTASQIAKYSYGIYLGHTYALYVAFRLLKQTDTMGITLSLLLTVLFAVAAYHLIESPFIEVGKAAARSVGRSNGSG